MLNSLLQKLDGQPNPKDWVLPGTLEIVTLVDWIQCDVALLEFLN